MARVASYQQIKEHSEDAQQEQLMQWVVFSTGKYPELDMLYHVPNGGKRNVKEAAKFKRMGTKAGVPDIVLAVPRGNYHGAYIELKVGKNKPTEKQLNWLEKLTQQGYFTAVCCGWESAAETIEKYLKCGG